MDQFADYYQILQISPDAEPETIQRVYRVLAQRFHPDNHETGDVERFLQITEAYKILSDQATRAAFDRASKTEKNKPLPVFMSREFTDGIESEAKIRLGILCLLYMKRRNNVNQANMTLIDLEQVMSIPREHLMFAAWYLRTKKLAIMDDRSTLTITAEGVDYLEDNLPGHQNLYQAFRGADSGYFHAMPALKSAEGVAAS